MKRSIDRKIQELQEAHSSDKDKEELTNLFITTNVNNITFFTNTLTIIYVLSIFAILHFPKVKDNLYLNFTSVIELVLSITILRCDAYVTRYVDLRLLQGVNVLIAGLIIYNIWSTEWIIIIYTLPLISTFTSIVFHHWIKDPNSSIYDLKSLKFKFKSA